LDAPSTATKSSTSIASPPPEGAARARRRPPQLTDQVLSATDAGGLRALSSLSSSSAGQSFNSSWSSADKPIDVIRARGTGGIYSLYFRGQAAFKTDGTPRTGTVLITPIGDPVSPSPSVSRSHANCHLLSKPLVQGADVVAESGCFDSVTGQLVPQSFYASYLLHSLGDNATGNHGSGWAYFGTNSQPPSVSFVASADLQEFDGIGGVVGADESSVGLVWPSDPLHPNIQFNFSVFSSIASGGQLGAAFVTSITTAGVDCMQTGVDDFGENEGLVFSMSDGMGGAARGAFQAFNVACTGLGQFVTAAPFGVVFMNR
jgi:hypothetical protein